jgi:UPF0271 protein
MDIDLNCDLGEGSPHDAELIEVVTSVNVACGFHGGDPATAYKTLQQAARRGVQAGAHPSFPDPEHFGRREMDRDEQAIFEDCVYQIGALFALARAAGQPLRHIKPHGALYNQACANSAYARPIVRAALLFDLPVFGLPGSALEAFCRDHCRFIAEGFADRRYRDDGSLMPRSQPGAFIDTPAEAVAQVEWLLRERHVQTICVHGDNPQAVVFARALRQALEAAGHRLVPCCLATSGS